MKKIGGGKGKGMQKGVEAEPAYYIWLADGGCNSKIDECRADEDEHSRDLHRAEYGPKRRMCEVCVCGSVCR